MSETAEKYKWKDPRKGYKKQRIEVDGVVVSFDGKGNPKTKVLKVYRLYGDVTKFKDALSKFANEKGYEQVFAPPF